MASLLLENLPGPIKRAIEVYPEKQPDNYRYKWMLRLPVHYNKLKFLQEHYNENCVETFLEDHKYECLKPIQERMSQI